MGNFLLSQSVPEQSDTLRHLFGWASGRSHQDYVNSLLMMLSWARMSPLSGERRWAPASRDISAYLWHVERALGPDPSVPTADVVGAVGQRGRESWARQGWIRASLRRLIFFLLETDVKPEARRCWLTAAITYRPERLDRKRSKVQRTMACHNMVPSGRSLSLRQGA